MVWVAVVAEVPPLAWEPPRAMGRVKKKKKKSLRLFSIEQIDRQKKERIRVYVGD